MRYLLLIVLVGCGSSSSAPAPVTWRVSIHAMNTSGGCSGDWEVNSSDSVTRLVYGLTQYAQDYSSFQRDTGSFLKRVVAGGTAYPTVGANADAARLEWVIGTRGNLSHTGSEVVPCGTDWNGPEEHL